MERLRLAADVRVRTVNAAHLVAGTPLTAARRRSVGLLERSHLHAEWRSQIAGRVRCQVFRVQVLLDLLKYRTTNMETHTRALTRVVSMKTNKKQIY